LQPLLSIFIAHAAFEHQCPERCVIEIVDMAFWKLEICPAVRGCTYNQPVSMTCSHVDYRHWDNRLLGHQNLGVEETAFCQGSTSTRGVHNTKRMSRLLLKPIYYTLISGLDGWRTCGFHSPLSSFKEDAIFMQDEAELIAHTICQNYIW
jgi:hypothetical protein